MPEVVVTFPNGSRRFQRTYDAEQIVHLAPEGSIRAKYLTTAHTINRCCCRGDAIAATVQPHEREDG